MPHIEKYTQAKVGLIIAHDFRAKNTNFKSADSNLENQNIYYVNNGKELTQVRDDNKKMLAAARKYQEQLLQDTPHAKRKDLVVLGEWIVNCPKDIPKKDQTKFLESAMQFVAERYGTKNIVSAAMHFDEPHAMPHLHITVVPVDKKGRVCARNVFTRAELQHFHPELEQYTSKVLGYSVHILKDEDERAEVSLPLSQYKVETKSKELDKKEKELKKQSAEVAEKLETAENTVSNARLHAVSAAAAAMENYDKTSALKRFFKDPRPFVRDMTLELQTAAELDRAVMDQRAKELETRELELAAEADTLKKEAELREQEEYDLQRRTKEAEFMYKQALAKEQAIKKREKLVAERENALSEREKILKEKEDTLKSRADEYFNDRAREIHLREVSADKIISLQDIFESERKQWEKEKEKWKPIEQANKKAEELWKKYESLTAKYNDLSIKNACNNLDIKNLEDVNARLREKNREIPALKEKSKELDKLQPQYNALCENYKKLSASHSVLKSLNDNITEYAKTITLENSFLSDIISDFKGRLTDKHEYTIQVCEQIEKKYIDRTSNENHAEAVTSIIDTAEKQKATYKAKIDDAFAAAIRESRTEQRSRGIHHESRSRGRSR